MVTVINMASQSNSVNNDNDVSAEETIHSNTSTINQCRVSSFKETIPASEIVVRDPTIFNTNEPLVNTDGNPPESTEDASKGKPTEEENLIRTMSEMSLRQRENNACSHGDESNSVVSFGDDGSLLKVGLNKSSGESSSSVVSHTAQWSSNNKNRNMGVDTNLQHQGLASFEEKHDINIFIDSRNVSDTSVGSKLSQSEEVPSSCDKDTKTCTQDDYRHTNYDHSDKNRTLTERDNPNRPDDSSERVVGNVHPDQQLSIINENESVLSGDNSVNSGYGDYVDSYDDSDEEILPGARRAYGEHSEDDEDEDDEDYGVSGDDGDEDFDSEHVRDADSHYSDAEDKQSNEGDDKLLSQPSVSKSNNEDHADLTVDPDNKELVLDADQDKSNPAYIPRTGRYFMHDYRETEEEITESKINEVKTRKDTRRWQHDRFRYREQAPRSRAELIRKYGYDIRKDTAIGTFTNKKDTASTAVGKLQVVEGSEKQKPVENRRKQNLRNVKEPQKCADLNRDPSSQGHKRTVYRSARTNRSTQTLQQGETKSLSRSLRGRFTVGQRRPPYSSSNHGRSDSGRFCHEVKVDAEKVIKDQSDRAGEKSTNSNEHVRTVISKNNDPNQLSGRNSQSLKTVDYTSRVIIQKSHPSRKSFVHSRGTSRRESATYYGRPVSNNAQFRIHGQNQLGENVAPRLREDHRVPEPGPKRYSTLRQSTDYRSKPVNNSISHPNEQVNRCPTTQMSKHSSAVPSGAAPETAFSHQLSAVAGNLGSSAHLIINDVTPLHQTESHFHPNSLSYSVNQTAQPYTYGDSHNADPGVYSRTVYPPMAPIDLYPVTGAQGYSEPIPMHPYIYANPIGAYQMMPPGEPAQSYGTSPGREKRPLLGRRPLKPLEIKDPRDRCQSPKKTTDQNTSQKPRSSKGSWSPAPSTAVKSHDT